MYAILTTNRFFFVLLLLLLLVLLLLFLFTTIDHSFSLILILHESDLQKCLIVAYSQNMTKVIRVESKTTYAQ